MSDDSTHTPEEQQAYREAAERERRLQVWLEGMLAGGPPLADAVKQWREGVPMYGPLGENAAAADEDSAPGQVKPLEESLAEVGRRVRQRRVLTGRPPLELTAEESAKRTALVTDAIETNRANGIEPTPLHLVLAARYIEGEINLDEYTQAILRL